MERYTLENNIQIDASSIDFTVRGVKNTKKPNIVRAHQKSGRPTKEKKAKPKTSKPRAPKPKTPVKTKSPERSPKKTLAQKLVIKMNFSPPVKTNKAGEVKKRRLSEKASEVKKRRLSATKGSKGKTETKGVKMKVKSKESKLKIKESKGVKIKVEAKGVKRKTENAAKPVAKKAKVIVNGKAKAVRSKPVSLKGKAQKQKEEKQLMKEILTEVESDSDEFEDEAEESVQEADIESDNEADISDGVNQVDASDYRYSLEEIDLNQVNSDDSDEEIINDDEDDEDDENDVDVENYENDNLVESSDAEEYVEEEEIADNDGNMEGDFLEESGNEVDEFKDLDNGDSYTASEQKVVVLSNPEAISNPDIIIGEYGDTDDETVQETVDTENCIPESEEENVSEDNTDIEKVERLLNRTEGMTVQDAYEASVRFGHFSDLQTGQRRSSRGTPSKYGNSARRSSYEKTRSLSDTIEWESKRTNRRTVSADNNKEVNENNSSVTKIEEVVSSVLQTEVSKSETKTNFATTDTKVVETVEQSPRSRRTRSSDNVSNEAPRSRKSSEIAKSPSRSPRSRTVSEPATSARIPTVQESAEDENRYGPDGKACSASDKKE